MEQFNQKLLTQIPTKSNKDNLSFFNQKRIKYDFLFKNLSLKLNLNLRFEKVKIIHIILPNIHFKTKYSCNLINKHIIDRILMLTYKLILI